MKKNTIQLYTSLFTLAFLLLTNAAPVSAQQLCPTAWANLCNIHLEGGTFVGTITSFILVLAIVVGIIMFVFGGYRWASSGGDKQKIAQARMTLIAAIVGVVIALFAYFIINFVMAFFTGGDLSKGFQMPKLVPK